MAVVVVATAMTAEAVVDAVVRSGDGDDFGAIVHTTLVPQSKSRSSSKRA